MKISKPWCIISVLVIRFLVFLQILFCDFPEKLIHNLKTLYEHFRNANLISPILLVIPREKSPMLPKCPDRFLATSKQNDGTSSTS